MLVRHGKTKSNDDGCYRAWSNQPEAQLDAQGRDGVRESALWLKAAKQKFPLIISDDLDRAMETREIIQSILNIPVADTDPRLRPLNVGDFTGKSKTEYPLEEYIKEPNKVIPGGESFNQFNKRQAEFFDYIAQVVAKLGPILIVCHGSTVAFLHNHFNAGAKVGYEGLVNPSGVLMFTAKGVEPLTKKREGASSSLADGTATAGFVTDEENAPPRECWNCKWFQRDANSLGECSNPVVRIDPALVDRRQTDGMVAVGEHDCCNLFVNKIGS